MLVMALICLTFEGIITALRIWLFADRKPCLRPALKANAWYVLLLVILPARLGEVAAVVIFERYLKQKRGAAVMSIITQRLYDVIVLGSFFLIALMGLSGFGDKGVMSGLALAVIAFSLFVLFRLDMFLTFAALIFQKLAKGSRGLFRKLLHICLQGRIYVRHGLKSRDIPLALLFTIGKWVSNLGAILFLFMAINLDLSFFESLTIAGAYNFLAIIPLQTIGGIGVGEAGLAVLFVAMGLTVSLAAGASLLIRFVILLFPLLFWVMVMGGLNLKDRVLK